MKKHKKTKVYITTILLLLTLAMTGFIFSNSLKDGATSSAQSGKVVEVVENLADKVGVEINKEKLPHKVRKTAHFTEFALLGILGFLTLLSLGAADWVLFFAPLGYSGVIAAMDEYLQTFSPGRAGQLQDVALDVSGAAIGIALSFAVFWLIRYKTTKKQSRG